MLPKKWSKEHLLLAFHLYCQLPFGKLHKSNPEIIQLANLIDRTPSSVAMKLVNFSSLDPVIYKSGRKGLTGASKLDREVWNESQSNWDAFLDQCGKLREAVEKEKNNIVTPEPEEEHFNEDFDFTGETRSILIEQRKKQNYFRRVILSSYRGRCCLTGLSDHRLLIASHIVPWSKDKKNRLNPSNGLCLSAIHDKAFDRGLITLSNAFEIIISTQLRNNHDSFIKENFISIEGKPIELPSRFLPDVKFIELHRNEIFIDSNL
jgi:hypothetical protein